jgi:hypothetical protein
MLAGIRNILGVYARPVRFFERFDLATPYGWPLAMLVVVLALAGYMVVAAGLVEREIDLTTEKTLAWIEKTSIGEVSRDQLDERLRGAREAAVFWKIVASGGYVLAGPVEVVGRIFVGAAVAFVAVALSGRKPAYHGLVAILTFAAYVEVLRQALVVPLMITLHSTDVETSLAVILRGRAEASGWLYAGLQAVDPFAIWFCVLAAIGMSRSAQLTTRRAVMLCMALWLGGAVLHVAGRFVTGYSGGEALG